ncbi:hypothetical protein [Pontibacter anaerobius]|uniref:Uncharacterized protein n=1 Tax=Pontibacter anaerobius TaxID=2993940 RepID=A0ABT3RJG6_9BACT|nr:hypothetical protein [Pontibacter anaerobius]MCX2741705.1 hypothetical protein [Pontibacter anaerobius]
MIDKRKYPLFFLQDVKKLFQDVRKVTIKNDDVLEVIKNEETEIIIRDIAKDSDFEFAVFNPQKDVNKITYTVQFNPTNSQKLDIYKTNTTAEEVIKLLNHWIGLIREYNSIDLTPEERILDEYEKEFYDDFEIVDEDADIKPYNLETQIKIHNFLLNTINILKENEKENLLLIKEADSIKNDLPNLTKRSTVKKLSKLFAQLRQKSLPLLKKVYQEAEKELFKRAIGGGFDYVGKLIDLIP